jgi:hypothetical protein
MNDIFKEQIVKRKATTLHAAIRFGLIFGVALTFIIGTIYSAWGVYIAVLAGLGAWFIMGRLNVEYEYVFTNGELDIDIIYNKASRKRIFNGRVADFEIMAHVDDVNHMGSFMGATATANYSSGETTESTYAFLTHYQGKRMKIIFEPNEMMFTAIATSLPPRKLFKRV